MAILGGSVTNKFVLGNFELRVGPQELAGKLTSEHSVGIVDKFSLSSQQETVDLNALFPQEIVDTAIVSQTSQLTATIREFSSRNFNLLAGNGFPEYMKVGRLKAYTQATGSDIPATLAFTSVPQYEKHNNTKTPIILQSSSTLGKFSLSGGVWDETTKTVTLKNITGTLNTTSSALDSSKTYTYVIPTHGGIGTATIDPSMACGFVASAGAADINKGLWSGNVLTVKLTEPDKTPTLPATSYMALIVSDGDKITFRVVKIKSIANTTGVLTVTHDAPGTAIPPTGSVVAYIYRAGNGTNPTLANIYGTLTAVNPYTAKTSETTAKLPESFSGASSTYIGGVLEVGNQRASITNYDGPSRTVTLADNLPGAAADKPFTLYTTSQKFSAKLVNDKSAKASLMTSGTATVNSTKPTEVTLSTPLNVGVDYGGWVATITFDGGSSLDYDVMDYSPTGDSDSALLVLKTEVAVPTGKAIKGISVIPPKSNYIGSNDLFVEEDGIKNDDILLPGSQLIIYDTEDLTEAQTVRVELAYDKDNGTGRRRIVISPSLAFDPHEDASDYRVELVNPIVFGKQKGSQYFTASLVMLDRASSLPVVLDFWKVTLASGINLSVNSTDFASTDMVLSILEPTQEDRATTYSGIADVINNHPMYRIAAIPDAVSIY